MGATKTSSAPLFSPFVNKEHLCGHSVDNLGTRWLRKCLFTIIVIMMMMIGKTTMMTTKVVVAMCKVFEMQLLKCKWMRGNDLVEWVFQSYIPLHLSDPLSPRYPCTQNWIPLFWYNRPSYKAASTFDNCISSTHFCISVYNNQCRVCLQCSRTLTRLKGGGSYLVSKSPPSKPARALIDQHTALHLNATKKYCCR